MFDWAAQGCRGPWRRIEAWLVLFLAAGLGLSKGAGIPAQELLRAADATRHVIEEGVISVRVLVRAGDETPALSELDVYVKGPNRTLCVFREGKQKARKVLVIGDRVWLIVPGSKRPIPVSANQRLLGGASVADLARLRLAEEFEGTLREGVESVEDTPCWVLDLKARSAKASYAAGVLWVGQEDRLPRRLRLTLRSGKEAKEILFNAFRREGSRLVLARMEIRHLLAHERGEVTVLDFLRYQPASLDSAIFSPGEAAAALVLETRESAARRGARILGSLIGHGQTGLPLAGPALRYPPREVLARARELAFSMAGISPAPAAEIPAVIFWPGL